MRHDQPNHLDAACVFSADPAVGGGVAAGRRGVVRCVPMGSLVAALLVALWLPSGPLMAAALISGEASALHAGSGASGVQRSGQKHTNKSGELRTLRRLSAALIIAVRSSHAGDACPLGVLRGGWSTDDLPLDRQAVFASCWTNTAGRRGDAGERIGLAGGVRLAWGAGLVALPPPSCV